MCPHDASGITKKKKKGRLRISLWGWGWSGWCNLSALCVVPPEDPFCLFLSDYVKHYGDPRCKKLLHTEGGTQGFAGIVLWRARTLCLMKKMHIHIDAMYLHKYIASRCICDINKTWILLPFFLQHSLNMHTGFIVHLHQVAFTENSPPESIVMEPWVLQFHASKYTSIKWMLGFSSALELPL